LCGGLFGYIINQKNMLEDKPQVWLLLQNT
jgi:hypothetical protein